MHYSNSDVLKGKPIRLKGQDLRTLPTYTIPEAASFLAMPQSTLRYWYGGEAPLLIASGKVGLTSLLSFNDLQEAYKFHLLRSKFSFSFFEIRDALVGIRKTYRIQHPLLRSRFSAFRSSLVIHLPATVKRKEQVVDLIGQMAVPEVVDVWGKRIITGEVIFPWRYSRNDDETRPVSIDPNVMSGRLVVIGTRIPVQMLWNRSAGGKSAAFLAKDYGISEDLVKKALTHFGVQKEAA